MTVPLKRLRVALAYRDVDLLFVADEFNFGGRLLHVEVSREVSEQWSVMDWDDAYDKLAREWRGRFGSEETL